MGGIRGWYFGRVGAAATQQKGVCTHVFHVAEGVVDRDDLSAVLLARRAADEAADAAEAGDTLHARRVGVSLNGATPNGGWRVV